MRLWIKPRFCIYTYCYCFLFFVFLFSAIESLREWHLLWNWSHLINIWTRASNDEASTPVAQLFWIRLIRTGLHTYGGELWWYQIASFMYSISQEICTRMLCCGYVLTDLPISIRLTSLALWQYNDCPSASKATLVNMGKCIMWIHYERLHNHNKAKHNKTVCKFLGIYCNPQNEIFGWPFPLVDQCKPENFWKKCPCSLLPSIHWMWHFAMNFTRSQVIPYLTCGSCIA